MIKYYLQDNGNYLTLGIQGDSFEEVLHQYYSFYNHEATDSDIEWRNTTGPKYFGTINIMASKTLLSLERLMKALTNAQLFKILNNNPDAGKGVKGGAWSIAKQKAQEIYDGMIKEDLGFRTTNLDTVYSCSRKFVYYNVQLEKI